MSALTFAALDGTSRTVDPAAVEALRGQLRGRVLTPDDEGYDEARRVWNGTHDRRPALIARCTGAADVMDAVNFAREQNLLLTVRGGGHNVAGTAVADGALVIDLSALRGVRVDPAARTADVQPGATLADLDRETQAFGLVVPTGAVSSTGVAGLTLGGGMSWVRRKYGLGIDSLLAVDIVTADGQFRRASEQENPDLFWAVRGGGGNFGVITSFRFLLHPLGPMVYLGAPIFPQEQAASIMPRWRAFCEAASEDVSAFAFFQTLPASPPFPEHAWNRQVVALPALYAGPAEQGAAALQPLHELGEPLLDLSGIMPYRALQQAFDWVFPAGARYYWKTVTLPSLADDALASIIELGGSRSSAASVVGIWQMGGAISRVPEDATGYGPRSHPWTVNLDSGWTDASEDERHISFTRVAWERLNVHSNGGMYLNYGAMEKPEQIRAAYGANYDRLARIKARYDPENMFRVNQNISPSG